MHLNTIRTVVGYIATLLRNMTGISLRRSRPESIYNYRAVKPWLHTSGQPTTQQLKAIHDRGFEHIINLAPSSAENALPNEAEFLAQIGAKYTHIPVDFKRPSEADFEKFVGLMQDNEEKQIWVHCAANMRVSAFIYRYRRDVLKEGDAEVRKDLYSIWDPMGGWPRFLGWEKPSK